MINFVNTILSYLFGADICLLTFGEITTHLATASSWIVILDPTFLISFVVYFFSFFATWQLFCVFPFRVFKRMIKFPSGKPQ